MYDKQMQRVVRLGVKINLNRDFNVKYVTSMIRLGTCDSSSVEEEGEGRGK